VNAATVDPAREQLPDSLTALAAAERLGAHRETFRPLRLGAGRMAAQVFFAVLGLACFILPGLYFCWVLARTPNLSREQAAKRLDLFEHGLVVSELSGPVHVFRWADLLALQEITDRYVYGVQVARTFQYTLHRPDGATATLTQFYAEPERWGAAIQSEVTRAQLSSVMDLLRRGGTARFGDLALAQGGIANTREALAWGEVEQIVVDQGMLVVRKTGKKLAWSRTPAQQVPNLHLLLTVAENLRRTSGAVAR